jgi:hypothetical protein
MLEVWWASMNQPLIKNAGDENQIKNAKIKENLNAQKETLDMQFILQTEQGRRHLWKLLEYCRIYESSADASGSMTYFKEGRRDVGLFVLNKIMQADPDGFLKMQMEAKKGKY